MKLHCSSRMGGSEQVPRIDDTLAGFREYSYGRAKSPFVARVWRLAAVALPCLLRMCVPKLASASRLTDLAGECSAESNYPPTVCVQIIDLLKGAILWRESMLTSPRQSATRPW
jgi:hypothetical protein